MKPTLKLDTVHQAPLYTFTSESIIRAAAKLICWPAIALLAIFGLAACEPEGASIAESQYATELVGDWVGMVGNERETMSFQAGGNFTATVHPEGFIGGTLSQGTTGTIRGIWELQGNVIALTIESAENEQTLNLATTSTIVAFNQNKLVVSSPNGESSTFARAE